MIIYHYYDPEHFRAFYKLESEGRFVGSFEDPEGMTKCQCFLMGLCYAQGIRCTDEFLASIPIVGVPMESI